MTAKEGKYSKVSIGGIDWGGLRRQEPVSDHWGFDRGQPIDRYFIEKFLAAHAADVQGYCLEVMNDAYTRQFGADRVTGSEVIDINANNPNATIVGDLTDPATLKVDSFDCFILTQTLPVIYDSKAVIRNSFRALKPGGVLLITAPCMCRYSPHPQDFWRFTGASISRLIIETTDCKEPLITLYGNLVASLAFLIGAATEELDKEELGYFDPRFPIVVCARVGKPL